MPMNREIELKGTIRPEHLDLVKNVPAIKKLTVGRARSRKLTTVYFDTPDHDLRGQGLSLRVRKIGGAYVQCVKQAHKRLGGVLVRKEWEGPVPNQAPAISVIDDKCLRRRIRRVGVERLKPVFSTNLQRRTQTLQFDDGSTAALDIDLGEIAAVNDSEPISEFELELKSGAPEKLFELATEIRKIVPFRLANVGKASRGYALLSKDEAQPPKYVKLTLSKDATGEQALTGLVQHCLDHLQANEQPVLTTDDSEGVHQMRVATRRLRAALQLFKSALPLDQYGWAVAEAKWLTDELSAARQWDVFAEEFVAPVARLYGQNKAFDALALAVEQARQRSRVRARDAVESERYTDFLLGLSTWLSSRAWRDQPVSETASRLLDSIGDHCAKLLQKRDRIVRNQGKKIEELPETALHELRLAVKKLRYTVDFFESLYPKRQVKPYRAQLSKLQDRFGYLNDVAAAETLIGEWPGSDGELVPQGAFAGGIVVGWHRHAAIADRQRLVNDMAAFLRTKPFWHST